MTELSYKYVTEILEKAHQIDQKCELFGASTHKYKLNPPICESVVRAVEESYGFRFPEDYVSFITKIGNGGAGPDYGLRPFEHSLLAYDESDYQEAYKSGLKKPCLLRPIKTEELTEYAFSKESYEKNPDKFFICEQKHGEDDECCFDNGFFILGTHGCQYDFGLVISGERKGQVFDTDNDGGYVFSASSFNEFYCQWLDWLSNKKNIKRELKFWHNLRSKRR